MTKMIFHCARLVIHTRPKSIYQSICYVFCLYSHWSASRERRGHLRWVGRRQWLWWSNKQTEMPCRSSFISHCFLPSTGVCVRLLDLIAKSVHYFLERLNLLPIYISLSLSVVFSSSNAKKNKNSYSLLIYWMKSPFCRALLHLIEKLDHRINECVWYFFRVPKAKEIKIRIERSKTTRNLRFAISTDFWDLKFWNFRDGLKGISKFSAFWMPKDSATFGSRFKMPSLVWGRWKKRIFGSECFLYGNSKQECLSRERLMTPFKTTAIEMPKASSPNWSKSSSQSLH
jgi:hypothetical protein